jgi:hypothetical protein
MASPFEGDMNEQVGEEARMRTRLSSDRDREIGKYLNDPDILQSDLPGTGKRRGILLLFRKICKIISESNIDFQTQFESIGKKSAFYHNTSGSVRTLSLRDQKPVRLEDLRDRTADIGVPSERIA